MKNSPHTVLCTVGTSLLSNLRRLDVTDATVPNAQVLKEAFEAGDWLRLGRSLAQLDPTAPIGGAEINTLA